MATDRHHNEYRDPLHADLTVPAHAPKNAPQSPQGPANPPRDVLTLIVIRSTFTEFMRVVNALRPHPLRGRSHSSGR